MNLLVTLPLIHLDRLVFTPLPQLRLRSALIGQGVCSPDEVTILEYPRVASLQSMLDGIIATRPDVVGFSCYTWNFVAVERLSRALKQLLPYALIVWGGPHVSASPWGSRIANLGSVDTIVTWYGEGSFPRVVSDRIIGILDGRGESPSLNELGYPYEWLPASVTDNISERVFLIESVRNCPFGCAYCLWGQADKHLDVLTSERMLDYTYRAVEQGARLFMFADAGLGVARDKGVSRDKVVFRRFADDGILAKKGVQLRGYWFWQTLDDETCEIIKTLIGQGVMGQLDLGLQTLNPDAIAPLHRPTNFEKLDSVVALLHKHNIPFSVDLIIGLPGDGLEGYTETLRRAISYSPERIQSFPLSILPGTEYDTKRTDYGIKTLSGSYYDSAETVIATDSFPYGDMNKALDLEAWMFLGYGERLFKDTLTHLAQESHEDMLTWLKIMMGWARNDGCPTLSELANIYRSVLYDSRSDGRYQLEARLMERFGEVYKELMEFCDYVNAGEDAKDTLRDELLTFPKTFDAAESLNCIDAIDTVGVWDTYTISRKGVTYEWKCDPVIGAICRNKSFYNWVKL